jgi:hypothetical protein
VESNRNQARARGNFEFILMRKHMKTSFLTLAAAALLLAGCSKQEISESISEGGSLVATPTNGLARLGRAGDQPSVKFKNSRIVIGLNNTKTDEDVALDAILAEGGGSLVLIDNETTPPTVIELPLTNNNGNENQRYRTPQFELSSEVEFDLFDIEIKGADGSYLWGASIFVREDGRAVENNPVLARFRVGNGGGTANEECWDVFKIIVADDPTNTVASIKYVTEAGFGNPDDPTALTEGNSFTLNKTHENPNIGRSRWKACKPENEGVNLNGSAYLLSDQSYDVPFLSPESNARIIAKYNVLVNDGEATQVLSDEPVVLGSRLASTSFGEQWQLEIAIADLGDWVETVNYVFEPGEGPAPLVSELPMQLTRTEGNLRVYTSPKFSFNGNPTGLNYNGIVYMFGFGTRQTASQADGKTELL